MIYNKAVSVTFEGDYDDIVESFATGNVSAREYLCEKTQEALIIDTNMFKNCTIRKGSVIVSFTVLTNSNVSKQSNTWTYTWRIKV